MKHNYFFKLLIAIVFCSLGLSGFAATPVYLSSGGDDLNNGLTSGSAVATLAQAMSLVEADGTIIVSGMVSATPETTLTKHVTIQGTSNTTDGFSGGSSARFISNSGNNLTLSNLKLTSFAVTAGNGGVLLLSGGTVNITNVNFDNNKALLGGAIYAVAGTITVDGCTIQNNDNSGIAGSKGGAIYVSMTAALTMNLNNTLIKSNKTVSDGAGIYYIDAAAVTGTLKFTNCAFISNVNTATTGAVAAAFAVNNNTASAVINVSFINTTIHDNTSGGTSGGAGIIVNLRNPSFVSFINCTIVNNKTTSGVTSVAGSGIRVLTAVSTNLGIVKFYNSILENNYCTGAPLNNTTYTTDFVWQGDVWTAGTHLIIENSMICRPFAATKYTLANFPNSKLNYLVSSSDVRNSYLAKFGTFNSTYNALPLLSNSFALGYGLKSHLTSLSPSTTTDQVGNSRSQATACDAGAIEVPRVSITSSSTSTTSDNPIPVTITFSNAVTGFDASDITVVNGTKGTLSGSGTTYTLNITPITAGNVTVDIAANAATDILGNGNTVATQLVRTYALAGSPPTVAISSVTSSTTQTNPIPVTITFSEAVTGFDNSDITVGNGTKSNFAGSGTTYTVDITPTIQGNVTVDVAADAAVNGSSTGNTAATQFVRTYYKDIYLSASGNDANNGFTPETAVASFTQAQTLAIAGEKIYVSGLIDFTAEPGLTQPNGVAISKNMTIQGTSNATDGFDGENLTRFFSVLNNNVTLKNLKLVNGYSGNNNGGAITMNTGTGSLTCENVIFDGNKTGMAASAKTGAAIHFDNVNGATFKNCVFSNNEASKAGAIYITSWAANSTILFQGCAFVGNIAKESFGGSAIYIRADVSANTNLNLINCTFKGNHVNTTANGGTVLWGGKSPGSTTVNMINCTVSGNTTAGSASNTAGVFFNNSDTNLDGSMYIKNCIIEGNYNSAGEAADFNLSAQSATVSGGLSGYMHIARSIIGRVTNMSYLLSGTNYAIEDATLINHMPTTWNTNDYKAKLTAFNAANNCYYLHEGSQAIDYGASTYLTSLNPTVTTDQLGNTRTVGTTNHAGAIETSPVATTTPTAPLLVAAAGNAQAAVSFTNASTGGSNITNYKFSLDGGETYTAFSPAKITSPFVFTELTNGTPYNFKLKAVNANGDGMESATSGTVTPHATANIVTVSAATNISALTPTPVSDIVVSSNVLTINQNSTINSLTVAPGAKVTVFGTYTLSASNGITLQSNASGTATLVDGYENPAITATVEQYLPQGRNWYVGSPVETNIANTGILTTAGATSVSYYSEELGWQHSYTGNLAEGVGYVAVSSAGTATNKANFSGKLNSGDVPVTLTRKATGGYAGYNLIANPYPSYINPMTAINANANLDGTIWYRTKGSVYKFETVNTTSGVGTNAAGTGMVTGHIPPMQAFWVRTLVDNQQFTFTNTMRLHAGNVTVGAGTVPTTALKAKKEDSQCIARIIVSNETGSDEAVLYFNENASYGFDKYDSRKMFESATAQSPEIYTTAGNEKLVINGLTAVQYDVEMPLNFIAKKAGDYSISMSEFKNFDTGARLILKDKLQSGTETELSENTAYNFSSQTVSDQNRFSLFFRAPGITTGDNQAEKSKVQIFVNTENQITIVAPEYCNYAIYNTAGQKVNAGMTSSNITTTNINLQAGVYVVRLNEHGKELTSKIIIK